MSVDVAYRLWISDADNQSKYMCTGEGDEGEDEAEEEEEGRQPLVFGNQSTVHFRSGDRISDSARGFWLYFESKSLPESTILCLIHRY